MDWEHALVSGNGRQGVLVHGGPDEVRLTLSHERLFRPLHPPRAAPDTAAILPELRALLRAGRYAEAAEAVCAAAREQDPAYAETIPIDALVGAATLVVRPGRRCTGREVDLESGLVSVGWPGGGLEVFVSRPADAIVVRLTGFDGGTVELGPIEDASPDAPLWIERGKRHTWPIVFRPPSTGVGEAAGAAQNAQKARREAAKQDPRTAEQSPQTAGSDAATARVVVQDRGDGVLILRTRLADEPDHDMTATFDDLLAAHTAQHKGLMTRVHLSLGDPRTEDLFTRGRYLITSSIGERPPTLQGVWSGTTNPPWSSGWTLNGNLPAAIAALHPTGTPELMLPLFNLLDEMRDDLRHNARRLYGARGVLTPTHLSTHGRQNHFGPVWCQTFWTAGAGWLARLYYDHWLYTGDEVFLRERALPFMREAADFLRDFVEIRDGVASFAPSYSPENAPSSTGSQASIDATMDVAIARDLLRNLGDPTGETLPAYRIEDGRLAEWIHPDMTDHPAHRHASHLWPLWYEPDPLITDDPEMRAAAVAAVRSRLAFWAGDEADEMGYGLAQLGLAAAALGLADEALWTLRRMADRYWRRFVPTHNRDAIFNVDIAGGFPAVVCAMLVRGAHGRVDLLPALPAAWPRGEVTGLRARGAVVVNRLSWGPDGVEATVTATRETRLTLTAPGHEPWRGVLSAGEQKTLSP